MFRYVTDAEAMAEKGNEKPTSRRKPENKKPATTSSLKSAPVNSGEEIAAKASKHEAATSLAEKNSRTGLGK